MLAKRFAKWSCELSLPSTHAPHYQLSPRFSGVIFSARESEAFGSNEHTKIKNRMSFWPVDCPFRLCLRIWSFLWPDSVVKSMVRHFIAYGCVNRSNKPECWRSWLSLPINNVKLLRTCLLKMKRKDPPVSTHSYLCSEHFSEDCFMRCVGGNKYPKSGSVPTRFSFSP